MELEEEKMILKSINKSIGLVVGYCRSVDVVRCYFPIPKLHLQETANTKIALKIFLTGQHVSQEMGSFCETLRISSIGIIIITTTVGLKPWKFRKYKWPIKKGVWIFMFT